MRLPTPDATVSTLLRQFRIVLVRPQESRNVGASARALASMGLGGLELVQAPDLIDAAARRLAVHALPVLEQARHWAHVADAVRSVGAVQVIGVSARIYRGGPPVCELRQGVPAALQAAASGPVAVLFGNEADGLPLDALQLCQVQWRIASDPACASLNLAAAVQVVAHELRRAALEIPAGHGQRSGVSPATLDALCERIAPLLDTCGWEVQRDPLQARARLRRMLERARPDRAELALLEGLLRRLARRE